MIAILQALPVFEDAGALPMVERLANGERLAAADAEARELAQYVLPSIRAFAEKERSAKTLLRADPSGPRLSATALRPVYEAPEANPQQLLRANQSDDSQGL